jgi:hypothetical protein
MTTSPEGVERAVSLPDPAAVPVPDDNVPVRRLKDETVFLGTGKNQDIHTLNGVATFIWDRIDGIATMQEILDAILNVYDVEKECAATDLTELVDSLATKGLVFFRP